MRGPVAPKDPEKSRPSFPIMKGKTVFGSPQQDGTGIQFLYQDGGRLINSAKIVGNITNEDQLELLSTVEGFRKLVHSIGITVESDNPEEKIRFVFQMYGKKDLYGGGTNLIADVIGDGMERKIYLSDYQWTEDDNVPGQIRFEFEKPEILATATVRFYLNDGFSAPVELMEETVDTKSENYCNMIQNSLMHLGNPYRIRKAIEKARAGKEVTLAYIGGSITQGAGATPINTECYAYKSYQLFQNRFASNNNVHFIKAGVGGTSSELGMIRFERDVLRDNENIDIIVVEYAVNDEGDETKGVCYESLVRRALNLPSKPAVILLFSVFADDYNLQDRLKVVGEHYDLPMVSIKNAVTPQFTKKKEEGRVLTKNQYFYDIYHPTNIGHTIMADCLEYLLERCASCEHARVDAFDMGLTEEDMLQNALNQPAAIGGCFENVKLLDKKDGYEGAVIDAGGFTETDTQLQAVEMDDHLEVTPEFPYNWMYDGSKSKVAYFEIEIKCKRLLMIMKDSGEVDAGKAEVYVDGSYIMTADPHIINWTHSNAMILFSEEKSRTHTVRIEVAEEDRDKKFTILGFGYVL